MTATLLHDGELTARAATGVNLTHLLEMADFLWVAHVGVQMAIKLARLVGVPRDLTARTELTVATWALYMRCRATRCRRRSRSLLDTSKLWR
jgi:hypothetical protein